MRDLNDSKKDEMLEGLQLPKFWDQSFRMSM